MAKMQPFWWFIAPPVPTPSLLYVGWFDVEDSFSGIARVNLDTYAVYGEPLVFPDVAGYIYDICMDDDFLYVFFEVAGDTSIVYKVNKETFTITDSNTLEEGDARVVGLTYDDTYIYAVCYRTPARVLKINKSTLERTAAYTFSSGSNYGRGIAIQGDYLYVILAHNPAQIHKLDLSLAPVDSLTLETDENHGGRPLIYDGKLYVPTRYWQPQPKDHVDRVVKIDLATFTREAAIALTTYAIDACNITREVVDGHFYVGGCFNTEIAKVDVATFTEVDVASYTGGYAQWGMEVVNGFLYIALDVTSPATITKIDLATFTEVETLVIDEDVPEDSLAISMKG